MDANQALEAYYTAAHDVDREKANEIVKNLLDLGFEAETIVFKVIAPTLEKMVQDFIDEKIILSQHFIATKISDEIIETLLPKFKTRAEKKIKIVIGCASGDFHGLGKKIVIGSLRASMIDAIDLGLNVSAEKFVDEALKNNANIIGVSSMMVHTAIGDNGSKKVRKILSDKGLENKIKLIVGGAPYKFDSELFLEAKADAWAANGLEAVAKINELENQLSHVN